MQCKAQYREEEDDLGLRRVLFRGKENVGIGKNDQEDTLSVLAHVCS